jgi:hypothetical protein
VARQRRHPETAAPSCWPHDGSFPVNPRSPRLEVRINGDCAGPDVQSLDGLFKRLLEEEEK